MNIDNFRNNDAVNMKPPKGTVPDDVREKFNFIRKGKVGGWQEHFKCQETLDIFNAWVEKNDMDDEGKPISGIRYNL